MPEGAQATSVHLKWHEIPVVQQGGELQHYNITYWVNGQVRNINKTDISIDKTGADGDGFISYEIENLQNGVEYNVEVYGVNQYLTDDIERRYYDQKYFYSEIAVTPKQCMYFFLFYKFAN